eukprot:3514615-Amphidinium_carterae.1
MRSLPSRQYYHMSSPEIPKVSNQFQDHTIHVAVATAWDLSLVASFQTCTAAFLVALFGMALCTPSGVTQQTIHVGVAKQPQGPLTEPPRTFNYQSAGMAKKSDAVTNSSDDHGGSPCMNTTHAWDRFRQALRKPQRERPLGLLRSTYFI